MCVRCGKPHPQYGKYCRKCIGHATYLEAIKHAYDPGQVRVNGFLYEIHPEPKFDSRHPIEPTGGRGFGGRPFTIRFFKDKRIVKTRNLWSSGEIPLEYREALPDNAEFLEAKGGAGAFRI
jgi:hypothetical protein